MLTDLRYALSQLRPLLEYEFCTPVRASVERAIDAIERCVKVAPTYLAAFDAHGGAFDNEARKMRAQADEIARSLTDADLEAMFAEVPADPMLTQMIPAGWDHV